MKRFLQKSWQKVCPGLLFWSVSLVLICLMPIASAELILPEAPQGYVLDSANILSAETIATLETELTALDTATSTQMVVVTVPSLQGYEPEQFALALGRAWGVGQEEFNNGLVFLIAPTEGDVRIEVGYGLEGAIPDATAWQIINNIAVPAFRDDDFNDGTLESVRALSTIARGEVFNIGSSSGSSGMELSVDAVLQILVFFFLFAVNWLSYTKSWWLGGVLGGIMGILVLQTISGFALCAIIGLVVDFLASKYLPRTRGKGGFFGGFGGRGGSGGGFGGFGGGGFGGGGAGGHF